jgi:hypothetical protein
MSCRRATELKIGVAGQVTRAGGCGSCAMNALTDYFVIHHLQFT